MALVEAVAGKLLDQAEQRLPLGRRQTLRLGPGDELLAEGGDGLELLLADRLDAGVGAGEIDPPEALQDPHHLLLVDHHAVRFLEHLLHHRMGILGRLAAMLDGDVVVDHTPLERPGAVEGVDGDDVAEVIGLHPLEEIADPAALELKDPLRLPAAEKIERRLVVEWEGERIGAMAGGLGDDVDRLGDDGQVAEAEEVHLHQAGALDIPHRPLRDHFLLPRHPLERDILDERSVGDHHRRGMGADIAGQPLDPAGEIDELPDLPVRLTRCGELAPRRRGLLDRDSELVGDERHDRVDPRDRQPHRPADVADRGPRGERAEGADLGDIRGPVPPLHILDDLAAALLAEVDVDIGRLLAVDVEEALEEEVVFERADMGEIERVGDQRPDARASGRRRDAELARLADEIPDDEEVAGEAEGVDDAELAVEPFHHLSMEDGPAILPLRPALRQPVVAGMEPFETEATQLLRGGQPAGHVEAGEVPLAELELDRHAVGDLLAAGHGRLSHLPRHPPERVVHLLGALQIELRRFHLHPRRVVAEPASVDAQEDVLGDGVLAVDVVAVAGGHRRDPQLARDLERRERHLPLHLQAVVLDLEEIPVAKQLVEPAGHLAPLGQLLRLVGPDADERTAELPRQASRQAHEPTGMGL